MRRAPLALLFALLLGPVSARADEEAGGSEAPVVAVDYLGTQRHALVIGIDDHADRGIPDLKGRESDARAVRTLLVDLQRGGVPKANVHALLGAEATAENIREALGRLASLPKEATVFVFFAGHGAKKGEDAYWVAQDTKRNDLRSTAIGDAEVRRLLADVPADRILLMMDCRHAPGLMGRKSERVDAAKILARYHGPGHTTLSVAGSEAQSIGTRSVFTHHLIEGLSGEADDDVDGVVALGELATYVERRVRSEARKRQGLERPVVDLADVPEPSRLLLTIEPEEFGLRLQDDEPAQTQRRERLEALAALLGEERITTEQSVLGRHLLGTLPEGFESVELEQRTLYVDLVDGMLEPEHLAGALVAIRRADRRILVVPDQFETVQAAVDAASAGDTVLVKAGQYDEHVVLKSGLRLQGEGREQTVIGMVPGEREILLAQDCAWGTIEGLQFDGAKGTELEGWFPDGIHLKGSTIRIRDCQIHKCLGGGVYAEGPRSRPEVRDCTIEQNKFDGIGLDAVEAARVVDCVCRSNGAVGIQLRKASQHVVIRDCLCGFNVQAGIGVCAGSSARVVGSECRNNGGHGILVWDAETSVALEGNDCSANTIFGVYVVQQATAAATGNVCRGNREGGIVVSGAGTRGTLQGNRCLDNDQGETGDLTGIVFGDGAHGEATSNTCNDNARGILVRGAATSVRLLDNECRGNEAAGIQLLELSSCDVVGNRCIGNDTGITVTNSQGALKDNTLAGNTTHGILIHGGRTSTASGNRCEKNEQTGIHVTDAGTRADLDENTCASNGSHGIEYAKGAGGTADGNDCRENEAFGIVATGDGTRPTLRKNRCTDNGRAGIGKQEGARPFVETSNVESGNGPR